MQNKELQPNSTSLFDSQVIREMYRPIRISDDLVLDAHLLAPTDEDILQYFEKHHSLFARAAARFQESDQTLLMLDGEAQPIALLATGLPAAQPAVILRKIAGEVTWQLDPIGLAKYIDTQEYPQITNWYMQELIQHQDMITDAAKRHGIFADAIFVAAMTENHSSINRAVQDPIDSNLLQDLAATTLNTVQSGEKYFFLGLLGYLLWHTKSAQFREAPLSRRSVLKMLGGASIGAALGVSETLSQTFTGPHQKEFYDLPPAIEERLAGSFELFNRRGEGIPYERSVGIAALKPSEIWELLFVQDIPVNNPRTGEAMNFTDSSTRDFHEVAVTKVGAAYELWLSILGSDTELSLELSAARMELALREYRQYCEEYNAVWRVTLPAFDDLEYEDQTSWLVWASTIAKGHPLELRDERGRVVDFGYSKAKRTVSKVHPQGSKHMLYCWHYLQKTYVLP